MFGNLIKGCPVEYILFSAGHIDNISQIEIKLDGGMVVGDEGVSPA